MNKNIGEMTHQIGAKQPTGESTQGEMTHGQRTITNCSGHIILALTPSCQEKIR